MHLNRRNMLFLVFTLLSFIGCCVCIFFFSPSSHISFSKLALPILLLFYACLFFCLVFFLKLITNRFIHGVSLGIFLITLLILKTSHLLQPFLVVLVLVLVLALEFAFWAKKK